MSRLERIKEDLLGALLTLGPNSLSDREKIEECDKILIETLEYIDSKTIKK